MAIIIKEMTSYFDEKKRQNLTAKFDAQGNPIVSYDYDADQLMEKFEFRNRSEEDFEKRTEYYFKNTAVAAAKVER